MRKMVEHRGQAKAPLALCTTWSAPSELRYKDSWVGNKNLQRATGDHYTAGAMQENPWSWSCEGLVPEGGGLPVGKRRAKYGKGEAVCNTNSVLDS